MREKIVMTGIIIVSLMVAAIWTRAYSQLSEPQEATVDIVEEEPFWTVVEGTENDLGWTEPPTAWYRDDKGMEFVCVEWENIPLNEK